MKHADLSKEALVGDVGYLYGLLQQAKLERKDHQRIIAQLQGRVVSEREQQRELRALRAADAVLAGPEGGLGLRARRPHRHRSVGGLHTLLLADSMP